MSDRPNVHDRLVRAGIDRDRLDKALKARDNWGAMAHSFEFLTVAAAVLETWPCVEADDECFGDVVNGRCFRHTDPPDPRDHGDDFDTWIELGLASAATPPVTVEAYETAGGKLAVKARSGELVSTKYIVGGYPFYVLSAKVSTRGYDDELRVDYVDIRVRKRTRDINVARRIARNVGAAVFGRAADGRYEPIGGTS